MLEGLRAWAVTCKAAREEPSALSGSSKMAPPVLLVDLEVFRPPEECRVKRSELDERWLHRVITEALLDKATTPEERAQATQQAEEVMRFALRVVETSGLSPEATFLPKSLHPNHLSGGAPRTDLELAYAEAHEAMCAAMGGLLDKTCLQPRDVDILVTTCSIYCPTPSLASMLINRFKLRSDVQLYHLGGMGCANGVIAVNLVRDLLKAHPNSNALLVTTEVLTPAYYRGRERSCILTNVIFRWGAAAALLSNQAGWARRGRAKYQLVRAERVNQAARDAAYRCIWWGPDADGYVGVALSPEVVGEAGRAVTKAMVKVAPYVLTWRQIASLAWAELSARLRRAAGRHSAPPCAQGGGKPGDGGGDGAAAAAPPAVAASVDARGPTAGGAAPAPDEGSSPARPGDRKPPQPRFSEGVQHFLLHAGGAKVLEGLGAALQLGASHLEPSRAVLHDYGNVSSSTTWYTLGYVESVLGVKRGDKLMQVGVGSGVNAGVNVWRALRDVKDVHPAWEHRVGSGHPGAQADSSGHSGLALRLWWLAAVLLLPLLALAVRFLLTDESSCPRVVQSI